jgi:DNA helicase HerA-like ATPase
MGSILNQLISESRKYHIYLNMAQQSLSQQDDKFNQVVLANVGNIITFRSPSPEDSKTLSKIYGNISNRDLMDLPNYNFYLRSLSKFGINLVNGEVIN